MCVCVGGGGGGTHICSRCLLVTLSFTTYLMQSANSRLSLPAPDEVAHQITT